MNISYISPSSLPSRAANCIHVVNMCEAFCLLGHRVRLFIHSNQFTPDDCHEHIRSFYGISHPGLTPHPTPCHTARGMELRIALQAVFTYLRAPGTHRIMVCRNLYAAAMLNLLAPGKLIYETHSPEKGFRKYLQTWLLKSGSPSIVISKALKNILTAIHGPTCNVHVLPDAARDREAPSPSQEEKIKFWNTRIPLGSAQKVAGYFGHLYPGRGMEIITGLAQHHPHVNFVIFGGNETDIQAHKANTPLPNLHFLGHLPPWQTHGAMAMMDVLLMPYQKSVSIGLDQVDTSQWMSPMKLFEYMSTGVPLISSDLPVLREILHHKKNGFLAPPDDLDAWSKNISLVLEDPSLSRAVARTALDEYRQHYTWTARARKMLTIRNHDRTPN